MVLSNIIAAIPPHVILGYNLGEWTELIAIISAFISLVSWLFKKVIVEPLMDKISDLSETINRLSASHEEDSAFFANTLKEHTEELGEIKITMARHDEELRTLWKRGNKL